MTSYERVDNDSPAIQSANRDRKQLVLSWCCLILAVVSMASVGPTFKWLLTQQNVAPARAVFWRNFCSILFFIPPTLYEYYHLSDLEKLNLFGGIKDSVAICREPGEFLLPCTTYKTFWYILIISACWSASVLLWIESLTLTTIVRASLLFSSYQLFLVLYLRAVGVVISTGELVGVVVSLLGIALSMLDLVDFSGFADLNAMVGDAFCLLGAIFFAVDLLCAATVRKVVPLWFYTFTCTTLVCVATAIFSIIVEGSDLSTGRQGLFGFVSQDIAGEMFLFAFIFGVCGVLGMNYCMKHIHPVVFGTVILADTPVTGLIGWIMGLESVPKIWTFIGGTIVILGIALVIFYEQARKNATEVVNASVSVNDFLPHVEMVDGIAPARFRDSEQVGLFTIDEVETSKMVLS